MNGPVKLTAADPEDLEMLSARVQDATAKLKDIAWLPRGRRFAILLNRYRWEEGGKGPQKNDKGSRVRSGLHFDSVLKVESQNVKQGLGEAVVSLLAIKFTPTMADDPSGVIELQLAGGGTFRLTVECIDAGLSDLTGPWAARARPDHESEG